MDLRYRLAVVTGAGSGIGRDVAVALSRVGAAVLAVDQDLAAAEETASLVRRARVTAWTLQADVRREQELSLLAARARDLGGIDLLVNPVGSWTRLTELFVEGLTERRGRRDGSPAAVDVVASASPASPSSPAPSAPSPSAPSPSSPSVSPADAGGARLMTVLTDRAEPAEVTRAVVALLAHGAHGEVVTLPGRVPA